MDQSNFVTELVEPACEILVVVATYSVAEIQPLERNPDLETEDGVDDGDIDALAGARTQWSQGLGTLRQTVRKDAPSTQWAATKRIGDRNGTSIGESFAPTPLFVLCSSFWASAGVIEGSKDPAISL